jgi:DNA polymerase bacteriophage-type
MTLKFHFDFETRSRSDLKKVGVYNYARDPSTETLCMAYALGDDPVCVTNDPAEMKTILTDVLVSGHTFAAHNAGFERLISAHILGVRIPIDRWDCTAARAARQALPRSLDGAAGALGLPVQKDREGHALMLRMCKPRRPRKGEPMDGIFWFAEPEQRARLAAYCAADVEVERLLDGVLQPLTDDEREVWMLTERINDRGVPVDVEFANRARWVAHEVQASLNHQMRVITDQAVPSAQNVPRLRAWLYREFGVIGIVGEDEDLNRAAIEALLTRDTLPDRARQALEIRLEAAKTSVVKYQALLDRASGDGVVRGNLVYHGASTGRWAGAGVQMQNMPRKVVKDFDDVADTVSELDGEAFRAKFPRPLDTLSQALRGTIRVRPETGRVLVWADYASVEARGVAWLAGAEELVGLFATGGKVYEEMAGKIYNRRAADIANPSVERHVGKTVILGCGYGMGKVKFRATCQLQGIPVDEALAGRAVAAYRDENPEIPALWRGLEHAALSAATSPSGEVYSYRCISFKRRGNWLLMRLPSGRVLYYRRPRVVGVAGPYGVRDVLEYDAVNSLTKRWGPETTWGGKLTENAVQGMCRDLIARAMLALDKKYEVILSVHDEIIVIGGAKDPDIVEDVIRIMCDLPAWADGFPLSAEGKRGFRYGK